MEKMTVKMPTWPKDGNGNKISFKDWPEDLKAQYYAYRKQGAENAAVRKNETFEKLKVLCKDIPEALELIKSLQEGFAANKPTGMTSIFGTEKPLPGTAVDFPDDINKLVKFTTFAKNHLDKIAIVNNQFVAK